jgi:hypothetical protein
MLIAVDYVPDATHIRVMANPRINITVTAPQLMWLEREAKRLGLTVGELVRRIIDEKRI